MRRSSKIPVWVVAGVAVLASLPLIGLGMLFGGTFIGGVYSLIFERQPTMQEMTGTYVFHGEGRPAKLQLSSNGSFVEEITEISWRQEHKVVGRWTYRYESNSADITFSPFDDPRPNGKHNADYSLFCYKRRFGGSYLQLDPDLSDIFEHE